MKTAFLYPSCTHVVQDITHRNMTQYELMVIVDPSLGDKGIETTLGTLKTLITSAKGKIIKEDVWGDRALAFKINGSSR